MKNIFSIDLESWVHFYEDSLKLRKLSSAERKQRDRGYMPRAVAALLALLSKYQQTATFFVVAEIHDWYPSLIEAIRKQGHEIGYHTHTHRVIKSADILEKEALLSRKFIHDFNPKGFRAPLIYLPQDAMSVLGQHGFTYSSSSYDEFIITRHGSMHEIPVSAIPWRKQPFQHALPKPLTFKLLFGKIPVGSGLSIAMLGSRTSYYIEKLNRQGKPAILFIHPWQLYQAHEITSFHYKLNLLIRNPLCFPYTRNIRKDVEKLFKAHQFTSFHTYFYEQQRLLGQ